MYLSRLREHPRAQIIQKGGVSKCFQIVGPFGHAGDDHVFKHESRELFDPRYFVDLQVLVQRHCLGLGKTLLDLEPVQLHQLSNYFSAILWMLTLRTAEIFFIVTAAHHSHSSASSRGSLSWHKTRRAFRFALSSGQGVRSSLELNESRQTASFAMCSSLPGIYIAYVQLSDLRTQNNINKNSTRCYI